MYFDQSNSFKQCVVWWCSDGPKNIKASSTVKDIDADMGLLQMRADLQRHTRQSGLRSYNNLGGIDLL